MSREPIVLTFYGEPPAHKNEKMPIRRRKKNGEMGMGLATKPAAKEAMNRLAVQITGEYRDLKIRHPHVEVWFYVMRDDFDRSNGWCCIEDLLWQYGVTVDDCVREFNGELLIHPAILCKEWKTVVALTPPALKVQESPRYIDPRRKRRLQPPTAAPAAVKPAVDELEEIPEEMQWDENL